MEEVIKGEREGRGGVGGGYLICFSLPFSLLGL